MVESAPYYFDESEWPILRLHFECKMSDEEFENFRKPILEKYEQEGNPYYGTARLWDDGVIDPASTRDVLALALSMSMNAPIDDPRVGVFRM